MGGGIFLIISELCYIDFVVMYLIVFAFLFIQMWCDYTVESIKDKGNIQHVKKE